MTTPNLTPSQWATLIADNGITQASDITLSMISPFINLDPFIETQTKNQALLPVFENVSLDNLEATVTADLISQLEALEGDTQANLNLVIVEAPTSVYRTGIRCVVTYTIDLTVQPTGETELAEFREEFGAYQDYLRFNALE